MPRAGQKKSIRARNAAAAAIAPPILPRRARRGPELLTRADVARLLDCKVGGVRKMQERGELSSEVVGGVHYFARAHVIAVRMSMHAEKTRSARTVDGAIAAAVFGALDMGKSAVAIVRELEIAPEKLETLLSAYERFNARATKKSAAPSRDDAAPMCAGCDEQPARYCAGCATPRRRPGSAASPASPSSDASPAPCPSTGLPAREDAA